MLLKDDWTFSTAKVYKSKQDNVVDPISSLLIYKGTKTATRSKIDVEMVDSNLHVFTRLKGRESYSTQDVATQKRVLSEILTRASN